MPTNPATPESSGVSRRTVTTVAAWTVPAVAMAVGAPLASASPATAGAILFSPASVSAVPGTPFPAVTIIADATSGTIDSALTFVLELPAGLTFADSSVSKTITILPSNADTATFLLDGPTFGIVALPSATVGTTFTPTIQTGTEPANWPITVNEFEIVGSVVPSGSGGWMWGQNTDQGNFVNAGSPQRAAFILDTVPGSIIDLVTYGGANLIRSDDTVWTPMLSSSVMQYPASYVPTLLAGEHFISASGQDTLLTSYGRAFHIRFPSNPVQYTFSDPSAPNGAFITKISLMSTNGSTGSDGNAGTYFLDSTGKVWQTSSNAFSGTDGYDYEPRLVRSGGTPITGIVAISAFVNGALALTSAGTVYTIGYGPSASATLMQQTSGGVTSNLDNVKTLAEMTNDNNSALIGGMGVIKNDGSVWSWGSGEGFRHTSSGSSNVSVATLNTQVPRIAGTPVALAMSFGSTFAIMNDNSVWSWGGNKFGNLGRNDPSDSTVSPNPAPVVDSSGVAISGTRFFALYRAMGVATV